MEGAVLQGVEREEDGGDGSPAGKDRIFGGDQEVGVDEVAAGDEAAP